MKILLKYLLLILKLAQLKLAHRNHHQINFVIKFGHHNHKIDLQLEFFRIRCLIFIHPKLKTLALHSQSFQVHMKIQGMIPSLNIPKT